MIGLFTERALALRLKAQSSLPFSGDKNRHLSDRIQPAPAVRVIQAVTRCRNEWTYKKLPVCCGTLHKRQAQGPGKLVLVTHQEAYRDCGLGGF